jgi:hypothetical protein
MKALRVVRLMTGQKFPYLRRQNRLICGFAFPDGQYPKAKLLELRDAGAIAGDIPPKFGLPIFKIALWYPSEPTSLMKVPKASVHEDRYASRFDRDIWRPWEAFDVDAKSVSELVQDRSGS